VSLGWLSRPGDSSSTIVRVASVALLKAKAKGSLDEEERQEQIDGHDAQGVSNQWFS
jgi:hypothetical protein